MPSPKDKKDKKVKKESKKIKGLHVNVETLKPDLLKNYKGERNKTRKLRHKYYFATLNTNKRLIPGDGSTEEMVEKLTNTLNKMLNNIGEYTTYKDEYIQNLDIEKDFKSVDVKMAVEIGPNSHCLHSHYMISYSYYLNGSPSIAYKKWLEDVNKELGMSVHVKWRPYSNNVMTFEDYIEKYTIQ